MTSTYPPLRFPSAELLTMAVLAPVRRVNGEQVIPVQTTSTSLDWGTARCRKVGGTREQLQDYPEVQVSYYEAQYLAAAELAERGCTALTQSQGQGFHLDDGTYAVIDFAEVFDGPLEVFWAGQQGRSFVATHRFILRPLPLV